MYDEILEDQTFEREVFLSNEEASSEEVISTKENDESKVDVQSKLTSENSI